MTDPVRDAVHTTGRIVQVALVVLAVTLALVAAQGNPYPLTTVSGFMAALVTQGFIGVVELLVVRPTEE